VQRLGFRDRESVRYYWDQPKIDVRRSSPSSQSEFSSQNFDTNRCYILQSASDTPESKHTVMEVRGYELATNTACCFVTKSSTPFVVFG
jgi:hypothetical protein